MKKHWLITYQRISFGCDPLTVTTIFEGTSVAEFLSQRIEEQALSQSAKNDYFGPDQMERVIILFAIEVPSIDCAMIKKKAEGY